MEKRFLRDHVLDAMIEELQRLRYDIANHENDSERDKHFAILHVVYETSRVVLERLEEVLEQLRVGVTSEEMIIPIAEAAMHLQNGLRNIHRSLKEGEIEDISVDELQAELNAAQTRGLFDPSNDAERS